ncbi:hypothetical protein [Streptomyces sp. NRRL F-5126]|uniref:hypothetical protein n=1 Tax=Streptomyces sp. NRRL F-5126 TaxID=1463857 RepID=UPI0005660173|nr:hypothetical protein [Streptomyces sp. NRRL F-5126]
MTACFGWCHWHEGSADSLKLVGVSEPSGYGEYACSSCRDLHGLKPVDELSLDEFVRRNGGGRVSERRRMQCFKGGYGHDFPIEDEHGAYCEEHGVEVVWRRSHPAERPPLPER